MAKACNQLDDIKSIIIHNRNHYIFEIRLRCEDILFKSTTTMESETRL